MNGSSRVKSYHYISSDGKTIGPITETEVKKLLLEESINIDTLVWDGNGDWKPIKDTDLAEGTSSITPPPPPPPPQNQSTGNNSRNTGGLTNSLAWGIALSSFVSIVLGLIAYIAAIIMAFIDHKKCKKQGIDISPKWMIFIPILYLWKRSKKFEDNKKIFWIGCAGIVVSVLFIFSEIGNLSGNSYIEENSCEQVTDMVRFGSYITGLDEFGGDNVRCEEVNVDLKISDSKYYATAILNTGDAIDITIRTDGDQVQASIGRE